MDEMSDSVGTVTNGATLIPVGCKSERGHLCYISIASNAAGTFSWT